MESILFCSVGRRVKLLKDFKETVNGRYRMIATDNSNIAPALYIADKSYLVPKITDSNYIDTILNICEKENVKAVLTLIDPEISLLAKNAEKFKEKNILLLVPEYKTACLCFDKYEMYKYLSEKGINTVLTYGDLGKFISDMNKEKIKFPVFVKPRTGSGSVGAQKVDNLETLTKMINEDKSLIIQELMTGLDLSSDIYVDAISHKVVNAFSMKKLSTKIGGANKTISFIDNKLDEFINRINEIFNFVGPNNLDFFYKDGEYYLSEINPRFGGSYIHGYASGVDFIKNIINNIDKKENQVKLKNYDEDIIMMMYDDIVIKKKEELVNNEEG